MIAVHLNISATLWNICHLYSAIALTDILSLVSLMMSSNDSIIAEVMWDRLSPNASQTFRGDAPKILPQYCGFIVVVARTHQ
jgi:hypothetical protein